MTVNRTNVETKNVFFCLNKKDILNVIVATHLKKGWIEVVYVFAWVGVKGFLGGSIRCSKTIKHFSALLYLS